MGGVIRPREGCRVAAAVCAAPQLHSHTNVRAHTQTAGAHAHARTPTCLQVQGIAAAWLRLRALLPKWRTALARQLVADAQGARGGGAAPQPQPFADFYSLAWARWVVRVGVRVWVWVSRLGSGICPSLR